MAADMGSRLRKPLCSVQTTARLLNEDPGASSSRTALSTSATVAGDDTYGEGEIHPGSLRMVSNAISTLLGLKNALA
ncbi:hypothetical protein ColLi_12148 [Colletotrichum liriopes]|uniref:Uncharacterized protein n=1 Tax=Colletotrichum liriopes TaxID=708192 RepID=A0AA37GZ19_9PEZI|nr:hypothetical protein ColLi_12148 [Colletotrichum liriopes]